MSSVAQRLHEAAQRLAIVTETPRLDAELLMAHAAGMSRSRLLACLREELARTVASPEEIDGEMAYLGRVLQGAAGGRTT